MKMELNEALDRLNRAGLIVEETTEDALARMAANSNEAIVEEIVEEIEKVRPVKNYYEVDPDDKGVTQQFEIVMEHATWEVQFRGRGAFYWRGNSYPWRIIQNNNGGFTQVAFSMSGLRSLMKKIKAIQSESAETLSKAGFLVEASDKAKSIRDQITRVAIEKFEEIPYDEFEQEPWEDSDAIDAISDEKFFEVMKSAINAKTQEEVLQAAEDEDKFNILADAWLEYLSDLSGYVGWEYTWNRDY